MPGPKLLRIQYTFQISSAMALCEHPKGKLHVRWWSDINQDNIKVTYHELNCEACQTCLVKVQAEDRPDGVRKRPTVVGVGDEQWYTTEVAYEIPQDAIRDGVPVVKE